MAEVMRVFQNGCASRDNRLLGIQTIAKVMRDHAVRFHIYTVMYGWRLALVPLEPADALVVATVMPVVTVVVAISIGLLESFTKYGLLPTNGAPERKLVV
jgi:hypothetical protein